MTALLLSVAAALAATPAETPTMRDGNWLLQTCVHAVKGMDDELVDVKKFRHCIGYIEGVRDMHAVCSLWEDTTSKGLLWCGTQEMQHIQLIRVAVKYLQDHPEQLHKPAAWLMVLAFREAFPCEGNREED